MPLSVNRTGIVLQIGLSLWEVETDMQYSELCAIPVQLVEEKEEEEKERKKKVKRKAELFSRSGLTWPGLSAGQEAVSLSQETALVANRQA